jgi:hypothetical protein
MANQMEIFDTNPPESLNSDRAVICHEVGHAVTWFSLGEAVGSLKMLRRASRNQLTASVILWPRNGNYDTLFSKEYAKPWAERLLSGDLATRMELGLETNKISTDAVMIDANSSIHDVIGQLDVKHDVSKVLQLAHNAARSNWHSWLMERLANAKQILAENWAAMTAIARSIEHLRPQAGASACLPGTTLITMMRQKRVLSAKTPAIEIVYKGSIGNAKTIARRNRRLANGIQVLYRDEPQQ